MATENQGELGTDDLSKLRTQLLSEEVDEKEVDDGKSGAQLPTEVKKPVLKPMVFNSGTVIPGQKTDKSTYDSKAQKEMPPTSRCALPGRRELTTENGEVVV